MANFFIGIIRQTTARITAIAEGSRMLLPKREASSKARALVLALALICLVPLANAISLSAAETERIGKRIWQNECAGTEAGLTSWDAGGKFAALGIGPFIWDSRNGHGALQGRFSKTINYISGPGA